MHPSSKIRAFAKWWDDSSTAMWFIRNHEIRYASAAVGRLFEDFLRTSKQSSDSVSVDPETLVGRRCANGQPESEAFADQFTATLSPPPSADQKRVSTLKTELGEKHFVRVGPNEVLGFQFLESLSMTQSEGPDSSGTVDWLSGTESDRIRKIVDRSFRHYRDRQLPLCCGDSSIANLVRRQISIASDSKCDFTVVSAGSESALELSKTVVGLDHAMGIVDGPLMDAELLEATLSPVTQTLRDHEDQISFVFVKHLEEMPVGAQIRLAEFHREFEGRFRLIVHLGSKAVGPNMIQLDSANELSNSESHSDDLTTESKEPWMEALHPPEKQSSLIGAVAEVASGLIVRIPRLVNRIIDIPAISTALLYQRVDPRDGRDYRLRRDTIDRMVRYPWPGDYEELADAMRTAIRRSGERRFTDDKAGVASSVLWIEAEDLPLAIRTYRSPATTNIALPKIDDSIKQCEAHWIQLALDQQDGNRAAAARALGMSRARLLRKIEELQREGWLDD